MRDVMDRLRWRLRLGKPGPAEQVAVAIAARELDEADVDLPTWRQAAAGARDDAHARERYVRRRVAHLRRELRAGSDPLLAADSRDRAWWAEEWARQAEAFRSTPEGERAYQVTLGVALRGLWALSLLYYAVVIGALLIVAWLAS